MVAEARCELPGAHARHIWRFRSAFERECPGRGPAEPNQERSHLRMLGRALFREEQLDEIAFLHRARPWPPTGVMRCLECSGATHPCPTFTAATRLYVQESR